MIFVVSGPSGSGKSTLCNIALREVDNLFFSVSHTTRPRRQNEIEGKHYYFVSEENFKKMINEEKFVEWAIVHGNYYGTSKKELEDKANKGDVLLDIDVQGANQVKSKIKGAIFIFILPPSYEELKRRIVFRRGDDSQSIKKRLAIAKEEIKHYKNYDYLIINDKLEKASSELISIIISQKCTKKNREKEVERVISTF